MNMRSPLEWKRFFESEEFDKNMSMTEMIWALSWEKKKRRSGYGLRLLNPYH